MGDPVFGYEAVQPGSVGGNRPPTPNDGVPVSFVLGDSDARAQGAVRPAWQHRGIRKDHGLCARCARQGGKGRKVAGKDLCSPHLIQDRRQAAKAEVDA